jgi:hypothetical protein
MVSQISLIYNQVLGAFPVENVEQLVLLKSEFVILDNCLLIGIPKFLYSTLPKPV